MDKHGSGARELSEISLEAAPRLRSLVDALLSYSCVGMEIRINDRPFSSKTPSQISKSLIDEAPRLHITVEQHQGLSQMALTAHAIKFYR
jgi:hypothetical protein